MIYDKHANCYCSRQAFSELKMPYTVVAADFADL